MATAEEEKLIKTLWSERGRFANFRQSSVYRIVPVQPVGASWPPESDTPQSVEFYEFVHQLLDPPYPPNRRPFRVVCRGVIVATGAYPA